MSVTNALIKTGVAGTFVLNSVLSCSLCEVDRGSKMSKGCGGDGGIVRINDRALRTDLIAEFECKI